MKKFTYLLVLLFIPFMVDAQVYLEEDFNAGFPATWTTIDNDGLTPDANVAYMTDAWVTREDFDTTGVGDSVAVSTSWYAPAGTSDDYMITPQLAIGAGSYLYYDVKAQDAAFPDGYELLISTTTPDIAGLTANPPLLSVTAAASAWTNISIDLATAGYASQNVYLGWRNNSTDQFLLLVDNVLVQEGQIAGIPFDVAINSITKPFEYTIIPPAEVGPLVMEGVLENVGQSAVTNAQLNIEIFEGGTSVSTMSSTGVGLATGATSTETLTPYTPTGGAGTVYSILYTASITEADGDASNDSAATFVSISDSTMARDDGVAEGGLGFTGGTGIFGNMFELTVDDTLTSVTALIGSGGIGDPTRFLLYGFGNETAGVPDLTIIDSTGFAVIAAAGAITLAFPCAKALAPGQYFLAIEQVGMTNIGCGYDTDNFIAGTSFFGDGTGWTDLGAVGFASALIIRMNLGTVVDRIAASVSSSSETVCAGESINLLASASSTVTYAWSGAGLVDTTGETVMAMPTVNTDYTVVASDPFGCSSSATISVSVNEAPAIAGSSTIAWSGLTNGTATATVTGGLAPYTYLWNDVNAQTAETAIGLGAGSYTVIVTDANGCTSTDSVTVDEATTGLDPLSDNLIQLYPNPSNGKFTLQGLEELGLDSEVTVRVMDAKGSEVHVERVQGQDKIEIDLSYKGLPVGLYMIEVRNEEARWTNQMMVK